MSANGYLAASELTSIGNGLALRTDAATSFLAMAAVAESESVQINWPGTASAYRPWAMQLDMRVHPALYGINPNMHALPGLPSSHGTGLAKDVPFGAPNDWMIANAARFGWTRPARTMALNDLNHWEFTPGTATASLEGAEIMALDSNDKTWLNGLGQAIIDQLRGAGAYADQPLTIKAVRNDIGFRDGALAKLQASITAVKPGEAVDLGPILAAIKTLPAATVAALKAAL